MFITYTHVDQLKSRAKKWQVNSYQNQRRKELKANLLTSSGTAVLTRRPRGGLIFRHSTRGRSKTAVQHGGRAVEATPKDLALLLAEEVDIDLLIEDKAPIQTAVATLRRDPFNSYPMDQSPLVQATVDYFIQFYAPLNAKSFADGKGGNWILSHLFPLALQADLLFESTMLLVWCHLPLPIMRASPEDHEKLYSKVRGSVMQKLHHRLSVPGSCSDDITIHTVVSLMAADFFHGMDDYAELHREGLRRIVHLRGGLTDGDLQPQTKYSITSGFHLLNRERLLPPLLRRTEMMCDFSIRRRNRPPNTNITPASQLVYPSHPFSSTLSQMLSTLPSGFSDLALQTLLSTQVIELLHRTRRTMDKGAAEFLRDTSVGVEMMRLSMEPQARALERAVVLLAFVFVRLLLDAACPRESRINNTARTVRSIKDPVRELAAAVFDLDTVAGPKFVLWAVYVLAAARPEYGLPAAAQDEILLRLRRVVPPAARLDVFLATVRKFFFHDKLLPGLKELWDRMMELDDSTTRTVASPT